MASVEPEMKIESSVESNRESETAPSDNRLVDYLRSAIVDGKAGLCDVPLLVQQVVEKELWRERFVEQSGATASFKTFAEFAAAAPPEGLGTSVKVLQRLCADYPAVLELLGELRAGRGGDRRSQSFKRANDAIEKPARASNKIVALRRLREGRPELHARVLRGELSVNRAMIAAGFRRQMVYISKDIERTAQIIRETFSPAEIRTLIELCAANGNGSDGDRRRGG